MSLSWNPEDDYLPCGHLVVDAVEIDGVLRCATCSAFFNDGDDDA